jgi:ElaB/YqjD/DUF883 family membrane-anchored ribosome-binding protein
MTIKGKHRVRKNHDDFDLYGDVAKIKAAIQDASSDVKNKTNQMFTDSIDNIKDQASSTKDYVEEIIDEKPFKAVGISLLVGMAIGYFLKK